MPQHLLLAVSGCKFPQLPDDRLKIGLAFLSFSFLPLRNQGRCAADVGAFADARRSVVKLIFPCSGIAIVGRISQALNETELPLDFVLMFRGKGSLAGLIGVVECRLFGCAAVCRNPRERPGEVVFKARPVPARRDQPLCRPAWRRNRSARDVLVLLHPGHRHEKQ